MAKRSGTKKTTPFKFEVISDSEAQKVLSGLRSGRGGRASKYMTVADVTAELGRDKALKVELGKNEVGGLRGYLRRQFGDRYTVKSARVDDGKYMGYVVLTPEEPVTSLRSVMFITTRSIS